MPARIARSLVASLVVTAAVSVACSPRAPAGDGGGSAAASDSVTGAQRDSVRVARLEREARALAKTGSCTSSEQCRVAPVGQRACGGPRDYLAYCRPATDSAALAARLDELARAERESLRASGVVSTCEMRLPQAVSARGGRCVTAPPGTGAVGGRDSAP